MSEYVDIRKELSLKMAYHVEICMHMGLDVPNGGGSCI